MSTTFAFNELNQVNGFLINFYILPLGKIRTYLTKRKCRFYANALRMNQICTTNQPLSVIQNNQNLSHLLFFITNASDYFIIKFHDMLI